MDECSLEEKEKGNTDYNDYNLPLSSITVIIAFHHFSNFHIFFVFLQTFVYLFAPICSNIRETDFDANMRLVNGKKIWSAMWEYRHPDVDCFTSQVCSIVCNALVFFQYKMFASGEAKVDPSEGYFKEDK